MTTTAARFGLAVAAFAIADLLTVTVKHRANTHTISASELVLVFALLFFPLPVAVGCQVVGLGIVLGAHRRQPPTRLLFNLVQSAWSTSLAAAVLRIGAPPNPSPSAPLWLWVLIAVAASAALNSVAVTSVASISNRRSLFGGLPNMIAYGAIAAVTSASFAILVIGAMRANTTSGLLALVPFAGSFLAYRAYLRERVARQGIEFLYETTKLLHHSPEFETALGGVVERALSMFRADRALMMLRRPDSDRWMQVTALRDAEVVYETDTFGPEFVPPIGAPVRLAARLGQSQQALLQRLGSDDAAIVALTGVDALIGVLVLVGKREGFAKYEPDDLLLFGRLADQVSIGLENGQLERSLSRLSALENELRHQATHDALTGLANRALLEQRLADYPEAVGAVLLIDLDDFKTINDSLGHGAGDDVLRAVAQRLGAACRAEDVVARLGGDEFAVLIGGTSDHDTVSALAERIANLLRDPMQAGGMEVVVGASIGVAFVARHDGSLGDSLRNADVALYEAKKKGKGRATVFERGMEAEARTRLELVGSLRIALEQSLHTPLPDDQPQLRVVYQPIVDLRDGRITGAEALVRWTHPTMGPLAPGAFIGIAEESGLIVELGEWVLTQATAALRRIDLACRYTPPLFMHVNVAARQFHEASLVRTVGQCLERNRLAAERLVLEITETSVMQDEELAISRLTQLKNLGVRIALDDFGTGYSSLSALRHLPIDVVKIDHSFIASLGSQSSDALVEAIVRLATTLRLDIVAEGIEHDRQRTTLLGLGCTTGQGFMFARPLPLESLLSDLMGRETQSPAIRLTNTHS